MSDWSFKREETHFEPIPEGRYRVRIKNAEKAVSKTSGRDMLVLQLEVSGQTKVLWHYIVFMPDKPEITNGKLTQIFDSFKDIAEGDFNLNNWIGKVGGAMIKHDQEGRERISYFLKADKVDALPAWSGSDIANTGLPTVDEDDMPF